MKTNRKNNQSGVAAFISIIVISAVTLSIAVSISLLGVGEAKSARDFKRGRETTLIAKACVEEALYRLKKDNSYTSGSLNVGEGSCSISISGTDPDRTIDVVATLDDLSSYTKRIQASAVLSSSSVNITNWQEVE